MKKNNFKNISRNLPISIKLNALWIVIATFIGAILEAISIGSLVGIILQITNIDKVFETSVFGYKITINKYEDLFIAIGIIFTIKAFYLNYVSLWQSIFIYKCKQLLGEAAMGIYLRGEYAKILRDGESKVLNSVGVEITQIISLIIGPSITLVTELMTATCIVIFLMIINPTVVICVSIFLVIMVIIYYEISKSRLKALGSKRQNLDLKRLNIVQGIISGYEEIKSYSLINYFENMYNKSNENLCKIEGQQYHLAQIPKLWLEYFSIISLILFSLLTIILNNERTINSAFFGMMFFSAFRLLPSFNRVLHSLQAIKYGEPSLDLMLRHFESRGINSAAYNNTHKEFEMMGDIKKIHMQDISFKYPGSDKYIFKNKNLTFSKGTSYAIVGDSGSGKSTILKILLGLFNPETGRVVAEFENDIIEFEKCSSIVGYVPQEIPVLNDSIRRNIAFGVEDTELIEDKLTWAVEKSGLLEFINNSANGLDSIIMQNSSNLSGGQLQRIGIARCLYRCPKVIILDEATTGLNITLENDILERILNLKKDSILIIISHSQAVINKCDVSININN